MVHPRRRHPRPESAQRDSARHDRHSGTDWRQSGHVTVSSDDRGGSNADATVSRRGFLSGAFVASVVVGDVSGVGGHTADEWEVVERWYGRSTAWRPGWASTLPPRWRSRPLPWRTSRAATNSRAKAGTPGTAATDRTRPSAKQRRPVAHTGHARMPAHTCGLHLSGRRRPSGSPRTRNVHRLARPSP